MRYLACSTCQINTVSENICGKFGRSSLKYEFNIINDGLKIPFQRINDKFGGNLSLYGKSGYDISSVNSCTFIVLLKIFEP